MNEEKSLKVFGHKQKDLVDVVVGKAFCNTLSERVLENKYKKTASGSIIPCL